MKKIIPLCFALLTSTAVASTQTQPFADCDKLKERDLDLLACNIYHESRNQPNVGQQAVVSVTINRLRNKHFPDTTEKVVWKKWAFSWTNDGLTDHVTEWNAWLKANQIASTILFLIENDLYSDAMDVTNGAMWYHHKSINPDWADKNAITVVLDDHIFYDGVLQK